MKKEKKKNKNSKSEENSRLLYERDKSLENREKILRELARARYEDQLFAAKSSNPVTRTYTYSGASESPVSLFSASATIGGDMRR